MQTKKTHAPGWKVLLMWAVFAVFTAGWFLLIFIGPDRSAPAEPAANMAMKIVLVVVGGLFLIGGAVAYAVMLTTNCLTFDYRLPVWAGVKARLYFADMAVLTGLALGFGFALTPFVMPALSRFGIGMQLGFLLPVLSMLIIFQIMKIFVQIWAPMERRIIAKRLQARGITPAQLTTAMLVGISDPGRSSFKKMSQVEDDIGALWVGPEQLMYWGDSDGFAIRREHLLKIERKADTGGTTVLCGLTHVILHLQQPDGSERQIRFHTEGHWTMAAKGRAMDRLEEAIERWQAAGGPAPSTVEPPRIAEAGSTI